MLQTNQNAATCMGLSVREETLHKLDSSHSFSSIMCIGVSVQMEKYRKFMYFCSILFDEHI